MWEKAITILAGNLNSGPRYLITAVLNKEFPYSGRFFGKQKQENLPQIGLFKVAGVTTSVVKTSPQYLLVRVDALQLSDEPEISIKSLIHAKSDNPFAATWGLAASILDRLKGKPWPAIAVHTVYTVQLIPEIIC